MDLPRLIKLGCVSGTHRLDYRLAGELLNQRL